MAENFERHFTLACMEETTTELHIGLYSFKTAEGILAFVKGRKLEPNEYAIISGPIIKKFVEQLPKQFLEEGD
jgi:hypothetical protein